MEIDKLNVDLLRNKSIVITGSTGLIGSGLTRLLLSLNAKYSLNLRIVLLVRSLEKALSSGKALEIFARMVKTLGGPADFVEKYNDYLPKAAIIRPVFADRKGYVAEMNTRQIGLSIISLKGGRSHPEQKLDYATGFSHFCQIGEYIDSQKPLAFIHAQTEEQFTQARTELLKNIKITETAPQITDPIIEKIS